MQDERIKNVQTLVAQCKDIILSQGCPVKISVPLILGIHASVSLTEFYLATKSADDNIGGNSHDNKESRSNKNKNSSDLLGFFTGSDEEESSSDEEDQHASRFIDDSIFEIPDNYDWYNNQSSNDL
jgi:hypothetical protein